MELQLLNQITDRDILGTEPALLPSVNRYASRGVLLDDARANIAMMYIAKTALYKLPGGGLEAGETPEAAFLREIREETGYDAEITHRLGYIEEHKKRNHYLQVSYCFIATAGREASETKLTEHEKRLGMAAQWMSLEEALSAMENGIAACTDYSASFMLLRDKLVLKEAAKQLARSGFQ